MSLNIAPMKGTTHTTFTLVAVTEQARIGFRAIDDVSYRIRVEPVNGDTFPFPSAWGGRPDDGNHQNRYSIVVSGKERLGAAILDAFRIVTGVPAETKHVLSEEIKTKTVTVLDGPLTTKTVTAIPSYF